MLPADKMGKGFFVTYEEAIAYIETQGWSKTRLGLERTRELLRRLGDPQRKLKFVHVAGSNGKGSCCCFTASVLQAAGFVTGLYISPQLVDFCERISVNGKRISHSELAGMTERVAAEADAMADHPSQFEISTAIAMLYFQAKACDIVVLEVGMGGRLDSTNVIDAPEVAAIMNIGLEHTEYLGDTLAKIAGEKAGIIKPGCSCVSYAGDPEALQVIEDVCHRNNVPLRIADFESLSPISASFKGQKFSYKGKEYFIPLPGAHQLRNAAVVLEIMETLRERGFAVSDDAVRAGLAAASWPARGELLSEEPFFLLDGGHNPQCAQVLADMLQAYLPGEQVVFLIGLLRDKDRKAIINTIAPYAVSFVCLTPENSRAMPAEELAAEIREETGKSAVACGDIASGIGLALGTDDPVVAFGSLYLAGYIRQAFPAALKKHLRKRCVEARRDLLPSELAEKSHEICMTLEALDTVQKASCVFSYLAAPDEVDLREFNAWAAAQGKKVCYPVCSVEEALSDNDSKTVQEAAPGSDGKKVKDAASGNDSKPAEEESPIREHCKSLKGKRIMDAYVPENPDAIEQGPFGIWSPIVSRSEKVNPEEIDLIILPCVGFDADGGRLGHGAGYYDRYLKRTPQADTVLVAFEAQRLPQCPMDAHDMPVAQVITEAGSSGKA